MATAPPRVLLGLCDAAVPPGEGLPWQGAASKLGGSPVGRGPAERRRRRLPPAIWVGQSEGARAVMGSLGPGSPPESSGRSSEGREPVPAAPLEPSRWRRRSSAALLPRGAGDSEGAAAAATQDGVSDWRLPAPVAHPACGSCGAGLLHVVQVYCSLEGSPYHRVINVFACATKSCWGNSESWKVLRSQYLQVPRKEIQDCAGKQEQERTQAATDWCNGADDWGEDCEEASSEPCGIFNTFPRETHCAALFQRMSLGKNTGGAFCNLAQEERTKPSSCVPEFQPYYISVVDEEDYLCWDDLDHAQRLLKEYQQREDVDLERLMSAGYTTDGSGEKYEKYEAEKKNQIFYKFMKRISSCQEQILRYSWNGQPLFITHPSADLQARIPSCNNCKSKRIFEFQLMPALVNMLKTRENDTSIEFGTAVVYTCEKSCWIAGCSSPLEEFIFVQEDPDQQLFK
ncbi:programmed cell death protein 2-like [Protobothrops mucrosquamatus]|uniref:programmed cell death protein 2-like n=1 Tax=Protobothrops mucrosquamatus TaxID=103944 RepID=UPI000775B6AD|nr:programmed cell death protein 2-like [Protobothrops mucrosquamatus]